MKPDPKVLSGHKQIFDASCVPMSVEFVLKLLQRLPLEHFPYQEFLGPHKTGGFVDYDDKTLYGVRFKHEFNKNPRSPDFPFDALFARMRDEIAADRFVIVSLQSGDQQWHMYIVYDYDPLTDDFKAVTEYYMGQPSYMQGTDILTYSTR